MEECELQPGQIVWINPAHDKVFGGCLMVVTEPKSWGAQGCVQIPGKGESYYRCAFESMEHTNGCAEWLVSSASRQPDD